MTIDNIQTVLWEQRLFSRLIASLVLLAIPIGVPQAQEVGSNFNHVPETIDFTYLEKANVDWIRVTPFILDYLDGKRPLKGAHGMDNIIEADKRGYKVAFGFRWDFKKRNMRVPAPNSRAEKRLFDQARKMLKLVGPHIDIFKLGNEPYLETLSVDLSKNADKQIPIIVFTQRLLSEVVEPLYANHPKWKRPDVYVGSMVWLYERKMQKNVAILGLIHFAETHPAIKGVALHIHARQADDIEASFTFLRQHLKHKPIIVPEFSLQRLHRSRLTEKLGTDKAGLAFARKYSRDPDMAMYEWYNHATRNTSQAQEWNDLLESRSWYPRNYMLRYYAAFEKYGVLLATYPLRFTRLPWLKPNSNTWFINPIFVTFPMTDKSGKPTEENPLSHQDFDTMVARGRAKLKE